jgi:tetratricopeptide (TPR) repeat protein
MTETLSKTTPIRLWGRGSFVRALILAVCLGCGASHADEAVWEQHNQAGMSAYQRGQYDEAEEQFKAALGSAKGFGEDDPRFATSLNNLAELYLAQGRYAEAEPLYSIY